MRKSHSDTRCSFLKPSSTPGPGTYDPPTKICEGPFYRIRHKFQPKGLVTRLHPGPGDYNLPKEKIIGGFIQRTQKRVLLTPDNIKSDLPGPGTYTVSPTNLGKHWSMKKPIPRVQRSQSTVGPGSYEVQSTFLNRNFSFKAKSKIIPNKTQIIVPGPGMYDPKIVKSRASVIVGTEKRLPFKCEGVPGPGTYEINLRSSSAATSFGYGGRMELKNSFECDTSYDLPTTIGEGPKLTIGARPMMKSNTEVPGPGTYNLIGKKSIPSYLFGSAKAELFDTSFKSPGPIYEVETSFEAPCCSFTWSRRQDKGVKNSVPGPGSYEKKSTLSETTATFKRKYRDRRLDHTLDIPGPGTYELEKGKEDKGWTQAKASRKMEWTVEEKQAFKKKIEQDGHCKTANPSMNYKKTNELKLS